MFADCSQTPWEVELARVVDGTRKRGKWASILVGGCCKTTDADIRRLRALVVEEDKIAEEESAEHGELEC